MRRKRYWTSAWSKECDAFLTSDVTFQKLGTPRGAVNPTLSAMCCLLLFQFSPNVISQVAALNSQQAFTGTWVCEVGGALHAGHASDGDVVAARQYRSDLSRAVEMIRLNHHLPALPLPIPLSLAVQEIIDLLTDGLQIRLDAVLVQHIVRLSVEQGYIHIDTTAGQAI